MNFDIFSSKKEAFLIGATIGALLVSLIWMYFFFNQISYEQKICQEETIPIEQVSIDITPDEPLHTWMYVTDCLPLEKRKNGRNFIFCNSLDLQPKPITKEQGADKND